MSDADRIRIRHMIAVAREAIEFAGNSSRDEIFRNRMLVRSLERQIEIAGEAASKISAELPNESPQIPWPDIVAMRNRLIHAYFDVNLEIVYTTVKEDLPALLDILLKLERANARVE